MFIFASKTCNKVSKRMRICASIRFYLFFLLLLFLATDCRKPESNPNPRPEPTLKEFTFSPNKIWAHRVNTFEALHDKHDLFEGLEIDLFYSSHINNFYVAHDEIDTLHGITLDMWIEKNPNPTKNWYWLDMKNLEEANAGEIASLLAKMLEKYDIFHNVICESTDPRALFVLKEKGFAVSLWVSSEGIIADFETWKQQIEEQIAYLKPNALSHYWELSPLLDTSFPNENILYWHTPQSYSYTPENTEITRGLCQISNVKVVLVGYDIPIPY